METWNLEVWNMETWNLETWWWSLEPWKLKSVTLIEVKILSMIRCDAQEVVLERKLSSWWTLVQRMTSRRVNLLRSINCRHTHWTRNFRWQHEYIKFVNLNATPTDETGRIHRKTMIRIVCTRQVWRYFRKTVTNNEQSMHWLPCQQDWKTLPAMQWHAHKRLFAFLSGNLAPLFLRLQYVLNVFIFRSFVKSLSMPIDSLLTTIFFLETKSVPSIPTKRYEREPDLPKPKLLLRNAAGPTAIAFL